MIRFGNLSSLFIFAILFLQFASVNALELTPESKLRKLSYQIRGLPPSSKDFAELALVKSNESTLARFYTLKLDEYFKSPWAGAKFSEKVFEDLRLENGSEYLAGSTIDTNKKDPELFYPSATPSEKSIIRFIQQSIIKGDSWDQILVSNSFRKIMDITTTIKILKDEYFNYGYNYRIQKFKSAYTEKGFKLDTEENILNAISEYDKTVSGSDSSSSPYFRNSKSDMKLTVLIIRGAFDNVTIQSELFTYLGELKTPLVTYRSQILSQTVTTSQAGAAEKLPQLIFNLDELSNRYKKTIYSKAAAFFRIYLCDDMKQVVLPGNNSKSQEAIKLLNIPALNASAVMPSVSTPSIAVTEAPPAPLANANANILPVPRHVQPACSGCHNKLDAMESIFNKRFVPFTTDTKPTPFEFVYDDYTGKEIRITIADVEQLPQTLRQQPQYIRCQSEKFWNWYIGEDVPLNPKQRQELEKVYIRNNSKPLEIIKYLTSLKTFSTDSFLTELKQFNNVRPIFQKCHACHKSDETIPSLMTLPFNFNRKTMPEKMVDHFEILSNIVKQTNILNDRTRVIMPPKNAGWKITESERVTLIKWIYDGAKDEDGNNTITPEQINKLLAPAKPQMMDSATRPLKLFPTLKSSWQRILNYNDIMRTLPYKIGSISECNADLIKQKFSLGHPDLYTGVPISDQPDNAYREAYRKCLLQILITNKQNFKNTSTPKITAMEALSSPGNIFQFQTQGVLSLVQQMAQAQVTENPWALILKQKWSDLAAELKLKIIQDQIHFVLGPNLNHIELELQLDKKILSAVNKVTAKDPSSDVVNATYYSLYYILNSDSFFIY